MTTYCFIMICLWFLSTYLTAFSSGSQTAAMRHNSLQNRHLKVAAEPWTPFFVFYCDGTKIEWDESCHDEGSLTYGGALWDLLKFIQHARNVTVSILIEPDGEWGVCYGKDNCTGMIGMVNRKEADFAIGMFIL